MISLLPVWKKGDIKEYTIEYSTNVYSSNKNLESSKTTKSITIEVSKISNNFIALIWRYNDVKYSDSIDQENPFKNLVNTIAKGLIVKYTISKNGSIKSISNYSEISERINAKVDSILEIVRNNENTDKSKFEMLKFQLFMMFSTKKQIDIIVLSDIFKFHQLYGSSYTLNKTTSIVDMFSDPTFEKPSDSLKVKLNSIDTLNKLYRLEGELISLYQEQQNGKLVIGRKSNIYYEFKYPENWILQSEITTNSPGSLRMNEFYKIKIKE